MGLAHTVETTRIKDLEAVGTCPTLYPNQPYASHTELPSDMDEKLCKR